jgi:hypothetical protein
MSGLQRPWKMRQPVPSGNACNVQRTCLYALQADLRLWPVSATNCNRCWPGKCWSNTQPHETRWPALQQAGIDGLFSAAVLSYPLGVRKPSPAFYRIVLAAAGCPAGHVLFVGDHLENDAAAPARHGMRTALVRPRGLRPGEVLPDGALLITHVRELPSLLQAA